jgi:hypothetical protein
MAFTNLEITDMVLIYGEARGHLELARQIYCERFPQRILPNARTFVNVVQHLRNFGRFEMNKRDLCHQREEDRILVAEEEILHETENRPRTSTRAASCKSPGSFSVCEFKTPVRKFVKTEASESNSAFLSRSY